MIGKSMDRQNRNTDTLHLTRLTLKPHILSVCCGEDGRSRSRCDVSKHKCSSLCQNTADDCRFAVSRIWAWHLCWCVVYLSPPSAQCAAYTAHSDCGHSTVTLLSLCLPAWPDTTAHALSPQCLLWCFQIFFNKIDIYERRRGAVHKIRVNFFMFLNLLIIFFALHVTL